MNKLGAEDRFMALSKEKRRVIRETRKNIEKIKGERVSLEEVMDHVSMVHRIYDFY